jgi:hypothetical protein
VINPGNLHNFFVSFRSKSFLHVIVAVAKLANGELGPHPPWRRHDVVAIDPVFEMGP